MSILPSAVLAITGASLYVGLETRRNYAYVHSAWHVLVAISLFLVLPEKRKCLGECRCFCLVCDAVEVFAKSQKYEQKQIVAEARRYFIQALLHQVTYRIYSHNERTLFPEK